MFSMPIAHVAPLIADIIRQGVQEGVFSTPYPEQIGHAIFYILQGLSDTLIDLLLASQADRPPERIESTIYAYTQALNDAVERVLGAPTGSLKLIDPQALEEWFEPSSQTVLAPGLGAG